MSYPPWPNWTEAEWRAARRTLLKKYDPNQPRHPEGVPTGGQFKETGRAGEATPDPVLASQAKAGISAVEQLLPEAMRTADYSKVPGAWEDLDEVSQARVRQEHEEGRYNFVSGNISTYKLDAEVRQEIEKTKRSTVLEPAKQRLIDDYKDVIDPKTVQFEPGALDPKWLGEVPLKWDALRHPDGFPLTLSERKDIQVSWHEHYVDTLEDALNVYKGTEAYETRREQLVIQKLREQWQELEPEQKWKAAVEMRLIGALPDEVFAAVVREPTQWVTGVEGGDHDDEDYARTHAIAKQLTVFRMDQLRKDRGLVGPKGEGPPPTFTIKETTIGDETYFSAINDATGDIIWNSQSKFEATGAAEAWAKQQAEQAEPLSEEKIISAVWDAWKSSSSGGLSLSLQLAAARELGGHHRLEPWEVEEAERIANKYGGMPTLQAYVRAQWEVTQMVMQKAGEQKIDVYRGLMLEKEQVEGTTNVLMDKLGHPVAPPSDIKELEQRVAPELDTPDKPPLRVYVTFTFNGERLEIQKERQALPGTWDEVDELIQEKVRQQFVADAKEAARELERAGKPVEKPEDISESLFNRFHANAKYRLMTDYMKAGKIDLPLFETTDEAVQRRVSQYISLQQVQAVTPNLLIKLPDLALQRAGAQSTTGTPQVANNWGGIGGHMPSNPTRVVIRVEAPSTSVLSLPVYGQNMQEEHEAVLMGTKDKWLWDAWRNKAPSFESQPISDRARKAEPKPLVVDLQAEDRGKPHWMSTVDWQKVKDAEKEE